MRITILTILMLATFQTITYQKIITLHKSPQNYQHYDGVTQGIGIQPYLINASLSNDVQIPVMVSLYSQRSFLSNCTQFQKFDCNMFVGCILGEQNKTHSERFINFEVEGPESTLNLHIKDRNDNSYAWGYYDTRVIMAKECGTTFKNQHAQGILGIGINPHWWLINYRQGIFISEDDKAQIIFGDDANYRSEKQYFNFTATVDGIEASLLLGDVPFGFLSTAYFDINMEYITFQEFLHDSIVSILENNFNLLCLFPNDDPQELRASCVFHDDGNFTSLPDIIFHQQNGDDVHLITPKMYLESKNSSKEEYYLMIAKSSYDEDVDNTIYLLPEYANSVILGAPIFKKYYVDIHAQHYKDQMNITFYEPDPSGNALKPVDQASLPKILLFIVIGLVGLTLIYCVYDKVKKKVDSNKKKKVIPYATLKQPAFSALKAEGQNKTFNEHS